MPFTRTWTFLPGNKIFPIRVDPLKLESQNQAKNIPEFPNQNLRPIGPGVPELWSDKQTNRHQDRQTEITTLYNYNIREQHKV